MKSQDSYNRRKGLRRLNRLDHIRSLLGQMILLEDHAVFLGKQHPHLAGLRPMDLLESDTGMAKVIELLEGMDTGSFA